ncbi:MAG: ABC transporter ATP-binding protein [Rhizobiales bacterium 63-7]|uniref:ABC transporter ATP-binding protein n=1 Tax=Rhizobium sp. YJ-22 TaxID=3037556 RepID=UPI00092C20C8|nr:ABC transporter ATP-binding protein [Rhizobium sp. YJ-22]MBN9032165.1 ABC transporter ATP-binding protein [Hyphomicrobiales bacterium]MDG3579758.1 ABC transporter ATP-binding protein [Rhizobium sp. YJ-22]OJU68539.1 MAG: ABC transporter ATP-binding protein [Rhizobiales bacterium 63-7]
MSDTLLSTHGLVARYGDFQALYGIDFEIGHGEVVALIGANGAGKSTLLKSIMGLLRVAPDMVRLEGRPVGGHRPNRMVASGVAIVPEGRRLFAGMSVLDNLKVAIDHAAAPKGTPWTLERVYDLFPILRDKQAVPVQSLSGGQQQMVAIARALLNQPRLLLCDEISLGLAPKVVREIYQSIPSISSGGTAIVLVEQDVGLARSSSDRLYCMLEGRVSLTGVSAQISREAIGEAYFGGVHAVA